MVASIVLWLVLGAVVALVIFAFVGKAKSADNEPEIQHSDTTPDRR